MNNCAIYIALPHASLEQLSAQVLSVVRIPIGIRGIGVLHRIGIPLMQLVLLCWKMSCNFSGGGFSHVGYFVLNCRYGILVPSSNLISALLRELKMQDSAAKMFKHRKR